LARVADKLGLHKSTVSRRVDRAKGLGYLRDEGEGTGHISAIVLGKPLPEEEVIYPDLVASQIGPLPEQLRGEKG
jgi:DNA-binding Lrp family transcriptional regulator